jgi:hypothetical protein
LFNLCRAFENLVPQTFEAFYSNYTNLYGEFDSIAQDAKIKYRNTFKFINEISKI